jgi:hypothetical protein
MKTLLFIMIGFYSDTTDLKVVKSYDITGRELRPINEAQLMPLGYRIDLMSDGTYRKRIILSR